MSEQRIVCQFYTKIGACRHGEGCSRIHNKPKQSPTVLVKNMYYNPALKMSIVDGMSLEFDEEESLQHFREFYEDVFNELSKFGPIEEMNVCANLGEHLVGNVYAKYKEEEAALNCVQNINGRYYAARPIFAELSPVTNFRDARCRSYDHGDCSRG